MIILETNRLILREFITEDFADLYSYFSDPEVMKFSKIRSEQATKDWIDWCINSYLEHGFGKWAIVLKSSSQLIGDCGISFQHIDVDGTIAHEIGYRLQKKAWGNGYATEAANACRIYAFEELYLNSIYSIMNRTNYASIRVAERNSMRFQKAYIHPVSNEHYLVYGVAKGD